MTEQEKINESFAQAERDAITLDFAKWSFQQRRANLPNDHSLWQQVRDRTLARQQSENAELRRKYLDGLEAAKAERQRERDAEIDLELAPTKKRLQNQWLVDNPTQTAADFEKKAWHLLKENLIEQRNADSLNAEIQRQAASGIYSL
jgi:preprotein translocase subunit SecD